MANNSNKYFIQKYYRVTIGGTMVGSVWKRTEARWQIVSESGEVLMDDFISERQAIDYMEYMLEKADV